MRITALLIGLALAGGAAAQPAQPSDVAVIMQQLGMHGLGRSSAEVLFGIAPSLQALDQNGRDCAATQIGKLLDAHFQQQIAGNMGDDGSTLVADWKQFMATPAGSDMARTFQASAAAQQGAASEGPQVSEANKVEIARFMATPAFQRFIDGLGADGGMPEDIGEKMSGALKRECRIDFDAEQIS